jgi:hypothetical protein
MSPVNDRKGHDLEGVVLQHNPRAHLDEINLNRGFSASQHDAVDQIIHPLQRPAAAVDLKVINRFPAGEGGYQAPQAEDVVEMAVSEEDSVEPLETQTAAQYLSLGPLAAVYQKAVVSVKDDL